VSETETSKVEQGIGNDQIKPVQENQGNNTFKCIEKNEDKNTVATVAIVDQEQQKVEQNETTTPSKEIKKSEDETIKQEQAVFEMIKDTENEGTHSMQQDGITKQKSCVSIATSDVCTNPKHKDLLRKLRKAQEFSEWKSNEITKALCDLEASQDKIKALEEEKTRLKDGLTKLKGQLLLSKRETAKAKERQTNRETSLRNAIANHHRLQEAYDCLESKFDKINEDLANAQKEARIRKEEAKEARQKASTVHLQLKKLQIDHSVVVDHLDKLNKELKTYKATLGHLHQKK